VIDVDAMDALVAQLQVLGEGLDAAFANAGSPEQYRGSIEQWHSIYDSWLALAERAANDANVLTEWTRIGVNIAKDGRDYAQQLADTSLSARCEAFIAGFPAAVKETAAGALKIAKEGTTELVKAAAAPAKEAAKSITELVVILGIGLALVLWMVSKSGARVHAGPIAVG
jgi:hypothetical protein